MSKECIHSFGPLCISAGGGDNETGKDDEEFITDELCCGNAKNLPEDTVCLAEGKQENTGK